MNKEKFIKELKKGNSTALDYVFEQYGNLIFKVAYSILNNRQLSEECVNDVLLKVWNNINNFNGDHNKFKTWIIVISKYTAIDRLRKEKKYKNVIELEQYSTHVNSIEDYLENKICREEILSEVNKFDKENKEIFIRRFFLSYSVRDISKIIGISENAVSNRIRRCKEKLVTKLKGEVI
ncbi:sigma-70 family RNA polymerase sigma factor [Clostridium tarantellae]|uniref:Sigma-70 family RNA polymerase sigma factor n=1 Tax=Clostridium tarantellae TaxID=39493 RepID=A0A6I1MLC2_9CLOT|nr:sigma-70 family RNA polymerase sigma factor [Clostridium tarantellae]MPQ43810.1 sigma-70 family RNA polymerase sigma factor [Clostridium tarantellae]